MKQPPSEKKREQHSDNDEINFQQHVVQMKKILFKLFTYYNRKLTLIPPFIIYLLNFIEFLQLLYYIVNPQLQLYPSESFVVDVFTTFLSYINLFNLIKYNTGQHNFILVILTFAFMIVTALLVYYSYLKIVKKELFWQLKVKRTANGGYSDSQSIGKSKTQTILLNLCVFNLLLIHTILTIPFYNVLFPAFYCTQETKFAYSLLKDTNCYDISHVGVILLALISVVILLAVKLCCLNLFYQKNPFKRNLFACDDNLGLLVKRAVAIAIVWYYMVDPLFTLKPLFIGALVLIFGWFLFMFRWQQIGFYNKRYMSFTLTLQILLLCFSLNNLIQFFIPSDTSKGIYLMQFVFCSIVLGYCASAAVEFQKQSLMDKFYINADSVKKGKNVQMFWIQLINYVFHEHDSLRRRINLKLLLKQLDRSVGSRVHQTQPQFVLTIQRVLSSRQALTEKQQNLVILQYLRIIVQQLIEIKQCLLFQGSRCSILFQQGFKTKSLCEIYKLSGQKLSWIDQFFLQEIKQRNCYNTQQSEQSQQQQQRQRLPSSYPSTLSSPIPLTNNNTNSSTFNNNNNPQLDQQKIVIYDQYISLISTLESKISKCLSINMEFWSQLLQQQPDFQYSKKLSSKLLQYHQQIVLYHQNIHSLFQNSIKTKFLFFSYLETLQWSQTHSEDILQFLQENQFNLIQKNSQKLVFNNVDPRNFNINFDENQKIVMIQLDFTSNQGFIRNTNSQVFNFLGYTKNQLIGRKIDKILPSLIATKHSLFVQRFMDRKESISKSSQRIVCAVHKNKYLRPGFLNIKVIYSQQNGMKLISFIRPLYHQPRTFGIMTTEEDSMIVGVTREIGFKVKDKQFLSEILNESVYMELLFPKLKMDKLQPNKVYETEMTTFNNLEQELLQQKNVPVSLRYQQNNYQQNLNFRYYFVKYLKLAEAKTSNRSMAAQTTTSELNVIPSFNTAKIIDSFQVRQQDDRQGKMEQLCRFKQNYLNKYNESKYYVCLLVFLIVFAGGITLCVQVFRLGEQFEQSLLWTKERMLQLSTLTMHVSILQTRWLKIYHFQDQSSLKTAKQQYSRLSEQFDNDLNQFKQYTTVKNTPSLFNLKIISQVQQQRLRQVLNFQSSTLLFSQLPLISNLAPVQLQQLQAVRNQLLKQTSNILQFYIDDELTQNLKMDDIFVTIQDEKSYYNFGIVAMQVLFLILSWLSLYHMKEYVEKNMEIIHFLTFSEIHAINQNLHEFLKQFLSSQLQSVQPTTEINSKQQPSGSTLQQAKGNGKKIKKYQKSIMSSQDQSSLNMLLQRDEFVNGIFLNNKILQKIKDQAQAPIKLGKDIMRVSSRKHKKQVRKRESERLSPVMHQLARENNDINGDIPRYGTSISKVSFNNLDKFIMNNLNKIVDNNNNLSNNNLSVIDSNDSLQLSASRNNLGVIHNNAVDQLNADKKGAKSHRRSSFRKSGQSLGMELLTSAFQLQVPGAGGKTLLPQIFNKNKDKPSRNNLRQGTAIHSRQGTMIRPSSQQQQPFLLEVPQKQRSNRKQRNRLQSLKISTIQMQYPTRLWWVLVCIVMISVFAGVTYLIYKVEQNGQQQMVNYGQNMNNLVKLDNKLMYLRSFILPYYMNITKNNNEPVISNQTLFMQISIVQSYMSLIYNQLLSRQEVLKDIYREITFYIYLLQTYPPNNKYLYGLVGVAPEQLSTGVKRVLDNLLLRHQDLIKQIQLINDNITKTDQTILLYYILQISVSAILLLLILLTQYYVLIWKLKVDQQATFNMVKFIPLQIVTSNKNILKTIKKQSTKQ